MSTDNNSGTRTSVALGDQESYGDVAAAADQCRQALLEVREVAGLLFDFLDDAEVLVARERYFEIMEKFTDVMLTASTVMVGENCRLDLETHKLQTLLLPTLTMAEHSVWDALTIAGIRLKDTPLECVDSMTDEQADLLAPVVLVCLAAICADFVCETDFLTGKQLLRHLVLVLDDQPVPPPPRWSYMMKSRLAYVVDMTDAKLEKSLKNDTRKLLKKVGKVRVGIDPARPWSAGSDGLYDRDRLLGFREFLKDVSGATAAGTPVSIRGTCNLEVVKDFMTSIGSPLQGSGRGDDQVEILSLRDLADSATGADKDVRDAAKKALGKLLMKFLVDETGGDDKGESSDPEADKP